MTKLTMISLLISLLALSCNGTSENTKELRISEDLIYYTGEDYDAKKHRLDLYLPDDTDAPLLLWIHGGAWSGGDRKEESSLAIKLAEQGIGVAAVSYRLSPAAFRNPPKLDGVQHPEHIKDIARAFAWIIDHGDEYGYDTNNVFVSGFSAGAHLASLLSMDSKYLEAENLTFEDVAGCIPVSGAFDIPKYYDAIDSAYNSKFAEQHVNGVFGTSSNFVEASPVAYISSLNVPMLVISDGPLTLYADTFKKALAANDRQDVPFIYYPSFTHAELYRDLLHNSSSEARKAIISFIKSNIRS